MEQILGGVKILKKLLNNDRGFSTPEMLALTVIGVIFAMVIFNAVKGPVDDLSEGIGSKIDEINN